MIKAVRQTSVTQRTYNECPVYGLRRRSLCSAIGYRMNRIEENYQRITDDSRLFDIGFWQSKGDIAIFEAVTKMLHDYFLIRGLHADELRLQRTIGNFRKA